MDNEGRRYSAMGARAAPRYPHPLPPPEKGDILMLQNEGTFSRCVDSGQPLVRRGIADGILLCWLAIWILPKGWVTAHGGWDGRVSELLFGG